VSQIRNIILLHYLMKSIRIPSRNCNPNFPVTQFPVVDNDTGWAHPLSQRQLQPEQLVMWGVGVWTEVGVLINPTGVLWDSGQDSGLASSFQEPYCPETIPSQTLLYDRKHCHANTDNRHHRTGLLSWIVCNGSKCPCTLLRLDFRTVLREGQVDSMKNTSTL
jgi:hypothetical protein